jgi:hypothetical protein
MSESLQKKAEQFAERLARGGKAGTRADQVLDYLTEKPPRREDDKERPHSLSLAQKVGEAKGPQMGGKKKP